MKRDRNSFFESSNFNMSAMGPNIAIPNTMNMGMGMPSVNAASSNFYAAQNMPMTLPNYTMPDQNMNMGSASLSELESRMARLERNFNRLEARLNKLEGTTYYTNDNDGNMYMV